MNWRDSVLFHIKAKGGLISRINIEPLLFQGLKNYDESIARLKSLEKDNFIERLDRKKHLWKLTEKGDLEITPLYNSAIELMELVKLRLEKVVKNRKDIELKGGATGLYFTYTNMSIFRFHPYKGKKGVILFVRLPNLIGESIDYKSNEIYVTKAILERTSFLEDIVQVHIKMLDEYYSHKG